MSFCDRLISTGSGAAPLTDGSVIQAVSTTGDSTPQQSSYSLDGGNSWTAGDSDTFIYGLAINGVGNAGVSGGRNNGLQTGDYGASWGGFQGGYNLTYWGQSAISYDGSYKLFTNFQQYWGSLWPSATGYTRITNGTGYFGACMSHNGQYQFGIDANGTRYSRSTDYGATFTNGTLPQSTYRGTMICSGTGQYVIFQSYGWIYRSTNYGVSFGRIINSLFNDYFSFGDSSYSGQYMYMAIGANVLKSSNYGETWSSITSTVGGFGFYSSVGCNASGSVVATADSGSNIKISTDYGATWVSKATTIPSYTRQHKAVAVNKII